MQLPDNNSAVKNLSALVDFANHLNSNLNLKFALNNLLLTCLGKLQTTKGIIALADNKNILQIELAKGIEKEKLKNFPKKETEKIGSEQLNLFLQENNLGIYEEINSNDKTTGYIFLGKKLSGKKFSEDDKAFLATIVKIGSTAITNSRTFEELKKTNKTLDAKINQLNSLFDLGKEFSGILEIKRISKLLVYSVTAQMLVSKYAIIIFEDEKLGMLENKFTGTNIENLVKENNLNEITEPVCSAENKKYKNILKSGIELIVPMLIKNKTKGLILLGKRMTNQSYSKSDVEYISSVGSLAMISIENSRMFKEMLEKQKIEKDLELARTIQQNLLPTEIPQSDKYEIVAYNKTARKVGGDFYDVAVLEKEKIIIAVADVSGKGIQASLLVANLQAFLKSLYKLNYPLNDASNLLNDLISENTTNGSFITAFWGILDEQKNEFTYVNMGHNPPLLIREGEIIKLKQGGIILGVMKTVVPYEYETVKLNSGDVIVLFTDGITEAMNINDEEFSDEKLEEIVIENANLSAEEIQKIILKEVETFTKGAEQSDDITCMVIKVK